jgi:glycosyltransferase involved in cell wall biosynthesis
VLHLTKGLAAGGSERALVSLSGVADPEAVTYEVAYLLEGSRDLVPDLVALGVPVHLIAGSLGMADPRWLPRLLRLARRFDVVHLHSPAVAALARPALRAMPRGPALVSSEWVMWSAYHPVTRVANALTLPLDHVRWAVSEGVVASSWAPWRARTELLFHGVPLAVLQARRAERAAARAAQGWADDDVVVVAVANLRVQKDYPTLFAAAAAAMAEEPRLRFVSIGQGPEERALHDLLATYDMGDRFTMVGYHADPPGVVVGADVFTLSSLQEGLPFALLEAIALGVAPVVTDVGGNAEVVADGISGLVVPPRSPESLAEAYVRLARDDELRASLAAAAAVRAEDFDIARTERIAEARYRSLVEGQRAKSSS